MDNIRYFEVTDKPNNVSITINESIVDYQKTDRFNVDILEDLVESKAYATAMLYLNENCILNLKESNFKESVEDFYKNCEDLLTKNISIVEEVGIPLCDISGYKIYEGAGYILRGEGAKKIKESFDIVEERDDDFETDLKDLCDYLNSNNINNPESQIKEIENYLEKNHLSMTAVIPNKLFKVYKYNDDTTAGIIGEVRLNSNKTWNYHVWDYLSEEGVQTDDIAPKVDQDLGTTPAKPKEKKKYYDILLSGLDESMDRIVNKGFIKNKDGQYERNGYILIKEGKSYKAINKNKINI